MKLSASSLICRRAPRAAVLALAALATQAACSSDSSKAGDTAQPADTQVADTQIADTSQPDTLVADTSPPDTQVADTTPPEDTKVPPDTTPPEDTAVADTAVADTAVAPPKEVRFVVLGDQGEGNDTQYKVAAAMRAKCLEDGCDFALTLGDNIYDAGVESVMDAQWTEKFEDPYKDLSFPFHPVLGNHDNGGFLTQWLGGLFAGAGAEFERGDLQVEYSNHSTKWKMPGRTYDFVKGPAHFFALDTNDMVWSKANKDAEARTKIQLDSIPAKIDASTSTWRIAYGHHPYLSNGRHGDAGAYEGLEEGITDLIAAGGIMGDLGDVVTGDGVLESLDTIVCGRADIYFAGHDHNRQWLVPSDACPGTTLVVSGGGSKLTAFKGDHPVLFQDDQKAGFFWVYLHDNQLEVEAIDEDGKVQWSHQAFK